MQDWSVRTKAVDSVLGDNQDRLSEEFQEARARLSSAEKGAIEQAMQDGWISTNTAAKMLEEADLRLTKAMPLPEVSHSPGNT